METYTEENSDFVISVHHQNDIFGLTSFCTAWVPFPMQDLGGIHHLLLSHTIFKLTSRGTEMVFWQCIFSPFLEVVMS